MPKIKTDIRLILKINTFSRYRRKRGTNEFTFRFIILLWAVYTILDSIYCVPPNRDMLIAVDILNIKIK